MSLINEALKRAQQIKSGQDDAGPACAGPTDGADAPSAEASAAAAASRPRRRRLLWMGTGLAVAAVAVGLVLAGGRLVERVRSAGAASTDRPVTHLRSANLAVVKPVGPAADVAPLTLPPTVASGPSADPSQWPVPARYATCAQDASPTVQPVAWAMPREADPPATEMAGAPTPSRVPGSPDSNGSGATPLTTAPSVQSVPGGPVEPSRFVLTGTMRLGEGGSAVINGQLVTVGEIIDGAKVVKVTGQTVELEVAGERFVIRMGRAGGP